MSESTDTAQGATSFNCESQVPPTADKGNGASSLELNGDSMKKTVNFDLMYLPKAIPSNRIGLTVRYEPPSLEDVVCDVVAIPGASAHPDQTWEKKTFEEYENKKQGSPPVNWLSDETMLPASIPNARIMSFGYDSQWYGKDPAKVSLTNVANKLLRDLVEARDVAGCPERPLVFIGHSLGGLVIISALMIANMGGRTIIPNATTGVVFLGTPFRGAGTVTSQQMISTIMASQEGMRERGLSMQPRILDFLKADSEQLIVHVQEFSRLCNVQKDWIKCHCFFEERETSVGFVIGHLELKEFVVSQQSGSLDFAENLSLDCNHLNSNKFSHPDDNKYKSVCRAIRDLVSKAVEQKRDRVHIKWISNQEFLLPFHKVVNFTNDFIGRDCELDLIRQHYNRTNPSSAAVVILSGIAGVGKSSVAARYYNEGDTSKYTAWFYLDGSTKATFDASFINIAEEAGIYSNGLSGSEIQQVTFKWLNKPRNNTWLILLENVDDPGTRDSNQFDFLGFITKLKQGSILVTTRQEWLYDCSGCLSISIQPLGLEDSFHLLRKKAKDEAGDITRENSKELLQLLAGIPLGIVQVGSYLKETPMTITSYTMHFKNHPNVLSMGSNSGNLPNYHPQITIETAWQITCCYIQDKHPAALEVFRYLAYLDCADIWLELLEDSYKRALVPKAFRHMLPAQSLQLSSAIGLLRRFSLVDYQSAKEHFSIHRLVQKWNMDVLNISINPDYLQWAIFCVGSKARKRGGDQYWTTSYKLLPHVLHCAEFIKRGQLQISVHSDPFWLEALHGIARILLARQVEPDLTRRILNYVISGVESTRDVTESTSVLLLPPTKYEVSLQALGTMGNMFYDEDRFAEAAQVYLHLIYVMQGRNLERTGAFRMAVLNYVRMLDAHGTTLSNGLDESQLCRTALDIVRYGKCVRNATNLMRLDKFTEAVSEFDSLRQTVSLGREDGSSIQLWKETAFAYVTVHQYHKARELLLEALPYSREIFGNSGQMSLSIHKLLGQVCYQLKQQAEAEDHLIIALEGYHCSKGLGRTQWAETAQTLGWLYIDTGRMEEAQEIFQECVREAEIGGDALASVHQDSLEQLKKAKYVSSDL